MPSGQFWADTFLILLIAKFAVRGFSEALIHDFRFNAPHLNVSVVMPGAVGTEIMTNSARILGHNQPKDWTDEEVSQVRERWKISGIDQPQHMDANEVRAAGEKEIEDSRNIGLTPAEAASTILECVRKKTWRILVGQDTESLDDLVRESPETAYDPDFVYRWRKAYSRLTTSADS